MPVLSVALALLAAVAFAVAAVLQHRSARTTALRHGTGRLPWLPVLGLFSRLVRDRWWLLGYGLNAGGFAIHATALHLGAIAVVQTVLVIQLIFALLISAARRSLRPTPRDWTGVVCVCTGIGLLVLLRGNVSQQEPAPGALRVYLVAFVTLLATLLITARVLRDRGQTRTALVAVAAGTCFCTNAVLLVLATGDIAERGAQGLFGAPVLGIVASSAVGMLLVQDAFAGGSMPTALTAMTITDPVSSALVGLVLFDAVRPAGPELYLGLPLSVTLVVTGVALVASSATLHDERHLRAASRELWRASRSQTVRFHG